MIDSNPRKPYLLYYFGALLVLLVLNALLFPALARQQIHEVDYGTFLTQLDEGRVREVRLENDRINYVAVVGDMPAQPEVAGTATAGTTTAEPGQTVAVPSAQPEETVALYVTGAWQDAELVDRLHAKGVKFTRVVPHESSPIVNFLVSWVLPLAIFIMLGQYLAKQLQKGGGLFGGRNAMTFGKANAKIYAEKETGKTFKDVAGQDEAKEALTEIVDFLHNPGKYADIGATLPKGALLVGPPGTGKTLLAKAVAGEAHVPFFSISGSEFVEMFVGMGAAKVRDLFRQAGERAPCIIFIDEIDTVGKKRDSAGMIGGNDEREQTLNQLLAEMDGFDGRKGVVILGATNRPDSLDPALLRPGRFDRRVPVDLPDRAGREAILRVHAARIKVAPDIDFNLIARATAGASGAELENIVNESAL
ncbi:MAG: ATP-dependent metallopeptidase FtsH/Yme1/Tma family protein, partial [Planctomycetes bacterium]|nr:ATP-dependent metallopeptidase FtsH/Yme1/Tma family protein [Planctomycetota bacterium]